MTAPASARATVTAGVADGADTTAFDPAAARAHLRRMRLVTEPVPKGPMREVAFAMVRVYNPQMLEQALEIMQAPGFGYRLVSRAECPAHRGWWRLYVAAA